MKKQTKINPKQLLGLELAIWKICTGGNTNMPLEKLQELRQVLFLQGTDEKIDYKKGITTNSESNKPEKTEDWEIMIEEAIRFVFLHPEGDLNAIKDKVIKEIRQLLKSRQKKSLI